MLAADAWSALLWKVVVGTMTQLECSNATIHYEQFGEGPDVVWVSGGGDTGSRWHPYQMPFF